MNKEEEAALDYAENPRNRYKTMGQAFLAGWHKRDKQPIVLTMKQVQDILCAAINCPQDTRAETHKRRFEEALNDK